MRRRRHRDEKKPFSPQWVFEEITWEQGFINYIWPKLESIARSGSRVYAELAKLKAHGGGPCVVMAQDSKDNLLATVLAQIKDGRTEELNASTCVKFLHRPLRQEPTSIRLSAVWTLSHLVVFKLCKSQMYFASMNWFAGAAPPNCVISIFLTT